MAKAIRLSERGGPEVLKWQQVEVADPQADEVLLRQTAVGVNFADVYLRTGLYPQPLPSGIGSEAAGVVAAVGRKVRGIKPGDHMVYSLPLPGAYAEQRVLAADKLLKIPSGISDEQAAASLIRRKLVRVHIGQRYPLAQAAQAQRDLESRRTIGSTVLP